MAWNLKQKAQDHIVLVLFGLITLLLLIVWRAVDPSVWDGVSAATPKRVLWALLGLESIAICLLSAALHKRTRKKKRVSGFGVIWDDDQHPMCPTCEVEMFIKHVEDTYDILQCPKCKIEIPLIGHDNRPLHLFAAKELIEAAKDHLSRTRISN